MVDLAPVKNGNGNGVGRVFLAWWPMIIVVLGGAVVWGETKSEQAAIKDRVIGIERKQEAITEIKAQQERIDERTRSILETQQTQQRLLETIIQSLRERRP